MARTSCTVAATGFSTSTLAPARMASMLMGACRGIPVGTRQRSIRFRKRASIRVWSVKRAQPRLFRCAHFSASSSWLMTVAPTTRMCPASTSAIRSQ